MTLNVTLNDLVDAVSEFAQSDAEVVATVLHMLRSRQVQVADEAGLASSLPLAGTNATVLPSVTVLH
jgi:hypothetical protein